MCFVFFPLVIEDCLEQNSDAIWFRGLSHRWDPVFEQFILLVNASIQLRLLCLLLYVPNSAQTLL